MASSSIINVINENDQFILVDPDTEKTITISASDLHGSKAYILPRAIKQHFLSFFPGKTECKCTTEADFRLTTIADWNNEYE